MCSGIRVFATGGIGGVHRGAEKTMDVSADLFELGNTPVCVVCAGKLLAGRSFPYVAVIHFVNHRC
jgi:pseudouridine-5'-phosphate glycosidase